MLAGRGSARRPWVSALSLLVVTAGLAVLLAVLTRQAWPPVVIAILGTSPALYLAYLAVPGVMKQPEPAAVGKPAYGRPVAQWDPVELGVHQVIGGGPMPTYVRRPHDELLRAVLDPTVSASRLVVLRGGSSTGKTRAAYEAVVARLADWRLDYPRDPAALRDRLKEGIPPRTVLWLGELRQYADVDGGATVLGRLADLLEGESRLLITTVWPEQWATYTAAAHAAAGPADPAGTAGRLLEPLPELIGGDPVVIDPARGGVIDVPTEFTSADLDAAARAGDWLLAEAAAAAASAGQAGQVTQYLAGVPDLLNRYAAAGGDPYGQAVITAAMDATRLGHASPLPEELVLEAAVGYLTGPQRTKDISLWRDTALRWAAAELKGAVQALQRIPPASGTGVAGYRVADYLDQYGRRTRQEQLGACSLWAALTAYSTSVGDLTRLGESAQDRGLFRCAATLWTAAVARGSVYAANQLTRLVSQVNPSDTSRAARWAAGHVSLENPWDVAVLLGELRRAGDHDAAATLLARDPATHVHLENVSGVAGLLEELRTAGADDQVATLLARDPATNVRLEDAWGLAWLLEELRTAGAHDTVATLATRAAPHAHLHNPGGVAKLLEELRTAGAHDAVATLLARDPATYTSLEDAWGVAGLLEELRKAGADDAVATLLARDPAAHASLEDAWKVARLLEELRTAGAHDAVATLLARDPATHARLDHRGGAVLLLRELRKAGADDAAATLLARDPATQAGLKNTRSIALLVEEMRELEAGLPEEQRAALAGLQAAGTELLQIMREAGFDDAAATLRVRHPTTDARPRNRGLTALLDKLSAAGYGDTARLAQGLAAHFSLEDPGGVAVVLYGLREAGADDAAATLLARDPATHARLEDPRGVAELLHELREAGAARRHHHSASP